MTILLRNCPHCSAEHVAFEVKWSERPPHQLNHIWNCGAVCGACGQPICFVAIAKNHTNHHPPKDYGGDIEARNPNMGWEIKEIWPSRPNPSAPPHTPGVVQKRYLEGEDAFRRKNWNSAVAMYRSALDIATKGMNGVPAGKTFFERLKWMHENHTITPDIRSWADHVRVEGNNALHDPDDFAPEDAKALRFFTEMFLRYVFELPGEVKAFREPPAQAS